MIHGKQTFKQAWLKPNALFKLIDIMALRHGAETRWLTHSNAFSWIKIFDFDYNVAEVYSAGFC